MGQGSLLWLRCMLGVYLNRLENVDFDKFLITILSLKYRLYHHSSLSYVRASMEVCHTLYVSGVFV